MRRLIKGAIVVGAALAVVSGGAAVADPPKGWQPYGESKKSDSDRGGRDLEVGVAKTNVGKYSAAFYAEGEHLYIWDEAQDGHRFKAYIHVAGYGTATYTTGNWRDVNMSFPEGRKGRKVSLKVCKNGTSVCSGWHGGGRT